MVLYSVYYTCILTLRTAVVSVQTFRTYSWYAIN